MTDSSTAPGIMGVYGSKISYYTGKFEAYLRFRSIPYQSFPTVAHNKKLIEGVGIVQMPVVQLADGRWMTDTTPMIAWLESQHDGAKIYPENPVLNFIALLIEDYADEWLWRSAMHYRWTYRASRQYAAEFLYNELVRGTLPLPRFLALGLLKRRQYFGFVRGDGVRAKSRPHADMTYLKALDCLQAILQNRPFLLGDAPTIADFGMMAPMFRHFSQDPTPAEIMRERAPDVYEWVARMWTAKPQPQKATLIDQMDDALVRFVEEVCETNLVQHQQNARAYQKGDKYFDLDVQGAVYHKVPVSRYRVWCLQQLRQAWRALPSDAQSTLVQQLPSPAAAVLWQADDPADSGYDEDQKAPFNRAINVFDDGVPKQRFV
ncbi:MAG: glutathione S-transferase C-terminal domain-containing protein [Pseudomonadota bacterium]